jgi:hypothetical protein
MSIRRTRDAILDRGNGDWPDGRTFWVRPVGSSVLESGNVVAQGLAVSLDKPLEWAVGFFFGTPELSPELWNIIAGISGFDD